MCSVSMGHWIHTNVLAGSRVELSGAQGKCLTSDCGRNVGFRRDPAGF